MVHFIKIKISVEVVEVVEVVELVAAGIPVANCRRLAQKCDLRTAPALQTRPSVPTILANGAFLRGIFGSPPKVCPAIPTAQGREAHSSASNPLPHFSEYSDESEPPFR